ncbi:MAG: LAGLIDADG family homing endonuclease [Candidatus Saccharimonadales bacterium]
MLEHLSIGLYYSNEMLLSDNQFRAENQQGRLQMQSVEPSETTRQTPRVTEAYLLGALHDGTYNVGRKTHRFSQNDIRWLELLQECLEELGFRSWIYKEGKYRSVYVLETSAKFLSASFNPKYFVNEDEKIAYIRGFFDA